MANSKNPRASAGLCIDVSFVLGDWLLGSQVQVKVLGSPVFQQNRGNDKDGNAEQVVVEHRVPVLEAGQLDSLSHGQDLNV